MIYLLVAEEAGGRDLRGAAMGSGVEGSGSEFESKGRAVFQGKSWLGLLWFSCTSTVMPRDVSFALCSGQVPSHPPCCGQFQHKINVLIPPDKACMAKQRGTLYNKPVTYHLAFPPFCSIKDDIIECSISKKQLTVWIPNQTKLKKKLLYM